MEPQVSQLGASSWKRANWSLRTDGLSPADWSVVSGRFSQLSRLQRHRLVYDALHLLIPRGIHALAIEARAPGEN